MAVDSIPIELEQYASLVAALYRGPLQDSPWSAFLEEARTVFQPCITVIGLRLPRPGDAGVSFVGGLELSQKDHQEYANKFSALDPLVDLPEGEVVALDDVISREDLQRTTYYRTFMEPFDQAQVIGFDVHKDGKVALFIRLVRGHGAPDFSPRDRKVLELLIPQFRELVEWMNSSRSYIREHSLFEQAFSSLAMATIILDSDLKVVHLNSIAEQLLTNDNGVVCIAGKLRLTSHRENQQFQHSLKQMLADEHQGMPQVIPIPRRHQPYPLLVTLKKLPLKDRMESAHHLAVYMTAPEMRQLDQTQLVVDVFELTQQEARLVIALANGRTLDDFVEEMGITKNTARSHLYSAFRKVGVSQQSSLVSHVIRAIYGL